MAGVRGAGAGPGEEGARAFRAWAARGETTYYYREQVEVVGSTEGGEVQRAVEQPGIGREIGLQGFPWARVWR